MSNRTDIVVETDNAEGQVLLSASRVYDLTEDKTQDTINSEVRNTLNNLLIADYDDTDGYIVFRDSEVASYDQTDGSIIINV